MGLWCSTPNDRRIYKQFLLINFKKLVLIKQHVIKPRFDELTYYKLKLSNRNGIVSIITWEETAVNTLLEKVALLGWAMSIDSAWGLKTSSFATLT